MRIEEVLASRTDLSTFLVHLTRATPDMSAKEVLKAIIRDDTLAARTAYGMAAKSLATQQLSDESQRVVCFTETPLAHLSVLTGDIEGRAMRFEPYGIAITRGQGRRYGANPVWYLDITPGHNWLTAPLNQLITEALAAGNFDDSHVSKLAPFVEQMGFSPGDPRAGVRGYRKEFWWEREWRHVGDFQLPNTYIILCPSSEAAEIRGEVEALDEARRPRISFIDPAWSLEMIIGRLAGFSERDLGPMVGA